jgi:hypothetical protein
MSAFDDDCETCAAHDRTSWGPGPWTEEPNRLEFEHAGLPCILHRGLSGAWCGYVGVAPGHPDHGRGYDDEALKINGGVDVHGGLTYAEGCDGHICHVPKPGESEYVWWFGFSCSEGGDLAPDIEGRLRQYASAAYKAMPLHYWTVAEVRAETERLAELLAARIT